MSGSNVLNVFVQHQQSSNAGGTASALTAPGRLLSSSSSSSSLNLPIAELRRRKISRSNLIGGSTMASMTPNDQRVKLERVIGMTVNSVSALACDPINGLIAYTAGCTVVLYSSKRNKQAHIVNAAKKNITCLAFSPDGNYLATAECGHQPSVRVWDVEERTQVVELSNGHNFGVSCLTFSPDMKYLISVGNQHDNVVNVWNWKNQRKSSSNKVSCKVKALSFSEDGSYFVTVGVRHVKFWYLERNKAATPKYQDTVPLQGRSAILSDQRNNFFCDVVCGRGATASKTFAITQSGLLCEFNNKRLLERWLDLKTRCASSISLAGENVLAGCAEGTVHIFKTSDLSYVATLPHPHCLGVDVASSTLNASQFSKYPDVLAMKFDETRRKLTCIYNDHSLYQWEVGENFKQFGKAFSTLAHGGCIWSIETYPSTAALLPPGTFFTGGSDDTVRVWNIDPNMPVDTTAVRKNIYSQELLKIVYADDQLAHLCDSELTLEKQENQYDGKSGIRALKTSPDGCHLATGDRCGNLRIYSLPDFSLLYQLSAHDSEVLCLEYSSPRTGSYFLASSSRDRLLHVLDPLRNYEPVCTIDDHSSSITSVKFARGASVFGPVAQSQQEEDEQVQDDLMMLSGGADKSIIIRKLVPDQQGQQQFVRANYIALQSTVYDMDVDESRNTVLAACQDRQIRVYHAVDGKYDRALKGSLMDENNATLIKLELDPSCTFVATSTSDKQTYVIDTRTGEFVASMAGHGELVTGLKFSNDCRHLFTVSGDGCIFVWRLATELTNRMLSRLTRAGRFQSSDVSLADAKDPVTSEECTGAGEHEQMHLPTWARKSTDPTVLEDTSDDQCQYKPRGKWATSVGKRPEPDGVDSSEGDATGRGGMGGPVENVVRAGSVQKILQQFETEKTNSPGGRKKWPTNASDFGSLANVRLVGNDDDDESKKENVVYCTTSDGIDDTTGARDFVVKERGTIGSKSYRGADTMGDLSDEESGAMSSAETASGIRISESVGELHPHHRMVVDAFEKLETTEIATPKTESGQSFERGSSGRQSITSRYLQRSGGVTGSPSTGVTETTTMATRSRWNINRTPTVPARVLGTPSITPSSTSTPAQDISGSGKRSTPEESASPLVDDATVSKAKSLLESAARLQNSSRRQTFAGIDWTPLSASRTERGDYASSELHQRSRSRSRTGLSPSRDGHNDSESDFSSSGYRHHRKPAASYFNSSSKLVSSRSMTSLGPYRQSPTPTPTSSSPFAYPGQQGGAMKRLSDIREKLRKSQENIAFGSNVSGATTPTADAASTFGDWSGDDRGVSSARSRSYGNLHHASATESANRKTSTPTHPRNTDAGRYRLNSLLQSRGSALSTGNLRDQLDVTANNSNIRTGLDSNIDNVSTTGTGSGLIGAIMDFKKRSISDLSQCTLTNENRSESLAGSFYGKATTMPKRNLHSAASGVSKKAQAVRSQRLSSNLTMDRMSVSGESEDSSGPVGLMTRSQMITTTPYRRQRMDETTNSSRSSSPSFNQQQKTYEAAWQILDAKQRQAQQQSPAMQMGSNGKGSRPVSSCLAKILNSAESSASGGAGGGNYFTGGGRHQSEGSTLIMGKRQAGSLNGGGQGQQMGRDSGLSAIVDSCDNHFEKMSGHCKDSVNQFRTSLDKVLQAYTMVADDTDLTEHERDDLLRMLSLELESATERLSQALNQQRSVSSSSAAHRYEPEGAREERAGMRRPQPFAGPMQQPMAGPALSPSTGGAGDGDQPERHAMLLQEYSDMLVTLIQQKMSSTTGK